MKKFILAVLFSLFSVSAFAFNDTVRVQWNDAGGEDSYQVERKDAACADPGTFNPIAAKPANVVAHIETVPADATYCYRVRAGIGGEYGPWFEAEFYVPSPLNALTVSVGLEP